jgi:hypothetical protein
MGAHRRSDGRQQPRGATDFAVFITGATLILRTAAGIHGTPGFITAASAFLAWPWCVYPLTCRLSDLTAAARSAQSRPSTPRPQPRQHPSATAPTR